MMRRNAWSGVLALLAALAVFVLAGTDSGAQGASISLDEARRRHEAGSVLLIDIREPHEHATGVARDALLLPMSELPRRWSAVPKDRPVLLICNTQNRSRATVDALRREGVEGVSWVEGGMSEWVRRGWPVVKPAAR